MEQNSYGISVDIICPLYNGRKYIENLYHSFMMQEGVHINLIRFVVTDTGDSIEKVLAELPRVVYRVIKPSEFSHSLTREQEALASDADIIVFATQDIIIKRTDWLQKLIKPIVSGEAAASYSRQICTNNSIEKYTREKNYPAKSQLKKRDDIDTLGFYTFFFSDASSAVKRDIFVKLNGYDQKRLPTNEDEYFAYKLIMNGYSIKYCADSEVIHSHKYSFRQLFKRYYETGKFFKMNPDLNNYNVNGAGAGLAVYILKRALQEKNAAAIFEYIPNMAARYLGMQLGKRL